MYTVTENGVLKAVESWSVILPLHDNAGRAFKKELVDQLLEDLLFDYPGFTVMNSLGYWKGESRVYIDQSYQIVIDTVPDNASDSSGFFIALKQKLQAALLQEKIYITKQDAKQELLSFNEFFSEIGLQATTNDIKNEAHAIAKQLAARSDFVLQRLGYTTSVLQRDVTSKNIVWERSICGLKLRSVFDDCLPPGVKIIAADQFAELGRALTQDEPLAVIGSYEFQAFILERSKRRPVIEAKNVKSEKYRNPYSASPWGEPLDARRFAEEFVGSIFNHCLILRDEGFLPDEIKVTVGSDGSAQWTVGPKTRIVMRNPAEIPDADIQKAIIALLGEALIRNEQNQLDPIAVLQAKAKNQYFLQRAIIHHTLKGAD